MPFLAGFPLNLSYKMNAEPYQKLSVFGRSFVANKDVIKDLVSRGWVTLLGLYDGKFLLMGVRGVVMTSGFVAKKGVDTIRVGLA